MFAARFQIMVMVAVSLRSLILWEIVNKCRIVVAIDTFKPLTLWLKVV